MNVCIHMCICMCVYVRTYVGVHVFVCANERHGKVDKWNLSRCQVYLCIRKCVCVYVRVFARVHVYQCLLFCAGLPFFRGSFHMFHHTYNYVLAYLDTFAYEEKLVNVQISPRIWAEIEGKSLPTHVLHVAMGHQPRIEYRGPQS